MRVARVLRPESASPTLALERDGALYDVVALAAEVGADELFESSADFHARVVALRGAGLDELDDRLRAGVRPSSARVLPDGFVWLPPCEPARAASMHVALDRGEPRVWLGSARAIEGHRTRVVVPREGLAVELAIAAIIGDELRHADARDAAQAVIGWSIALRWGVTPPATPEAALAVVVQLGPVLVSRAEAPPPDRARFRLRAGATVVEGAGLSHEGASAADAIARASALVPLEAGDVVILGPLARAHAMPGELAAGAIERLGVLEGTAVG